MAVTLTSTLSHDAAREISAWRDSQPIPAGYTLAYGMDGQHMLRRDEKWKPHSAASIEDAEDRLFLRERRNSERIG